VTAVDRASRCILGWQVLTERTSEMMQTVIDGAPAAYRYYSDAFPTYATLVYDPGQHQACADKSQTYSVEADNAELRHYLARLARRSRCFSRCLHALRRAIKLFVFAWNRRQLYKRAHPKYPAHLADFVCP
jgi:insertion element IS1 protein InsB